MGENEFSRIVVVDRGLGELGAIHSDIQVLSHLEVEMREIHPTIRSDGADLLPLLDPLIQGDISVVEVPILGIDHSDGSVGLAVDVPDDDAISPSDPDVLGKDDNAVGDSVDGVAEVCIATADSIPVLSEMPVGPVTACFVVSFSVGRADRIVESVSELQTCVSSVNRGLNRKNKEDDENGTADQEKANGKN